MNQPTPRRRRTLAGFIASRLCFAGAAFSALVATGYGAPTTVRPSVRIELTPVPGTLAPPFQGAITSPVVAPVPPRTGGGGGCSQGVSC